MNPPGERFQKLVQRLRDKRLGYWYRFEGGATEDEIAAAERELGVPLPPSFRWFLREFGATRLWARIYGVRPDDPDRLAKFTLSYREWEKAPLPRHLVIFGSEWGLPGTVPRGWTCVRCCFDTSRHIDGEYPILLRRMDGEKTGERRTRWTFLNWLEKKVREAEGKPGGCPSDWSDAQAWEYFWRRGLEGRHRAKSYAPDEPGWREDLLPLIQSLEHRRPLRILCAGNGTSFKPYVLAHCGHDVTALDVSPSATRRFAMLRAVPVDLKQFFPEYSEGPPDRRGVRPLRLDERLTRERIAREHRHGGRVTPITAGLFTYTPSEPYDLIYTENVVERFPVPQQAVLAQRFFAWLRPDGLCAVQTAHGGIYTLRRLIELNLELAFRAAGFFFDYEPARARQFVETVRSLLDHPSVGLAHRELLRGVPFPSVEDLLGEGASNLNARVKKAVFWHGYDEYESL